MSKKRNKQQPQNKEVQLQNNKIQLQTDDTVLFSMEQTKLSTIYGKTVDDDTHNKISSIISPIISQLPNVAKSIQGLQSYEAIFSPQMKEMLKNGTAVIHMDKQGELLPQIVHTGTNGKKGQIIKKVRLKSGMTPANIALIGWQIASMITAQKHLYDINEKLAIISKDVKDVKNFLEDEFYSKIEARIRATINLMTSISKNPDFFQEFKEFHAQNMGANMEKTDELILRLDKMIANKIAEFSKEIFKEEGDIDKTVKKYQNKVQEIIDLIKLSLQLMQIQHILCMIYAFYAENTTYAKTWRESLKEHQQNLKNKIKNFEEVAKKQAGILDYSRPWWAHLPGIRESFITTKNISALTDLMSVEEFDINTLALMLNGKLDVHITRKLQKNDLPKIFLELNSGIDLLFNNMQKQANSINSEYRVIIDLNNGEIDGIRLLNY